MLTSYSLTLRTMEHAITSALDRIEGFYNSRKRMPSVGELANLFGYKSKNAAVRLISKLVAEAGLEKDETGRLLPPDDWGGIPMLGLVEAGFPSPAEEELIDTMSIDDYMIKHRERTYILTVKGDSMIEAGILPGDLVLVERGREPKEGQIVVANVDGGWTMKYFRRRDGHVVLEPANRRYKPIIPRESLEVGAVVKGVIRRY